MNLEGYTPSGETEISFFVPKRKGVIKQEKRCDKVRDNIWDQDLQVEVLVT